MKNLFSIGEISKMQNISRQTLIFYDKIGLFKPSFIDSQNGYRYYSSNQLDYLDTICIMKKIGFSLEEIKNQMNSFTTEHSINALSSQRVRIDQQIKELQMIKSRVDHRYQQLKQAINIQDEKEFVSVEEVDSQCVLVKKVEAPYTLDMVSIATKECFAYAFKEHLPIYFQSGVVVPYKKILRQVYTEATLAFLSIENKQENNKVIELPKGMCVCAFHKGDYLSIGKTYQRVLNYCQNNNLEIISDSYEFAINDYLSTGDEKEYITKIMFYIS